MAGFGLITFVIMLLNMFLLPILFPRVFLHDDWTIYKEVLFILWNIGLITIMNWLFINHLRIGMEQHSLATSLSFTLAIGLFPSAFMVMLKEKSLSRANEKISSQWNSQLEHKQEPMVESRVIIQSDSKNETLHLDLSKLICIAVEGNYSKVYFKKHGLLESTLLRTSLSNIEKQLPMFDDLQRCHRSFIINRSQIEKVTGNARSCSLHLSKLDFSIPVSREQYKLFQFIPSASRS